MSKARNTPKAPNPTAELGRAEVHQLTAIGFGARLSLDCGPYRLKESEECQVLTSAARIRCLRLRVINSFKASVRCLEIVFLDVSADSGSSECLTDSSVIISVLCNESSAETRPVSSTAKISKIFAIGSSHGGASV